MKTKQFVYEGQVDNRQKVYLLHTYLVMLAQKKWMFHIDECGLQIGGLQFSDTCLVMED